MAITASRYSLGMDREVMRETAASKGRASLMRKGLRQAKKEKNYDKALGFAAALEGEGQAYGMTGSAADASSIAQGRVASREALATQMRSQSPGVAGATRESRVAAAKAAGTFDATREKYNKTAAASGKTMDEAGNIVDLPKEPPGAPPPSPTPGATPPAEKPPVKVAATGPRDTLKNAFNSGRVGKDMPDEEKAQMIASAGEVIDEGSTDPRKRKQEANRRLLGNIARGQTPASVTRSRPGMARPTRT